MLTISTFNTQLFSIPDAMDRPWVGKEAVGGGAISDFPCGKPWK